MIGPDGATRPVGSLISTVLRRMLQAIRRPSVLKVLSWLLKAAGLGTVLLFFMMYAIGGAFTWGVSGTRGISSFAINHSNWPNAHGYVIAQSVNQDGLVFVTFVYGVGGRPYSGTQYWSGDGPIYSRGDPVTIYYDASKPSVSVVDPSRRQAPMFDLLTQPAIMSVSFLGYAMAAVWAWASCCASLVSKGGRSRPRWSWKPRGERIWRILGTGIPMATALVFLVDAVVSRELSSGSPILLGAVGVYVIVPLGLSVLLKYNNFLSGWMGALGRRWEADAQAIGPIGVHKAHPSLL